MLQTVLYTYSCGLSVCVCVCVCVFGVGHYSDHGIENDNIKS